MTKRTIKQFVSLAVIAVTTASTNVIAQSFDSVRLFGAAQGSDGGLVGVGAVMGTEYRGSDQRRNMLVPLLDYQWSNGWFAGTSNGVGYNFSKSAGFDYGVRLTADLGRKESRSDALRGMGDISAKAEYGVFLNYALTREFTLTSSYRYGSRDNNKGGVLDLGAVYSFMLAPSWRMALGAATSVVDSDYMQTNFGVTKAQAASSAYAVYIPKSGIRDLRASSSLTYIINPRASMTAVLSYSRLASEAKNSPLTRDSNSLTGVMAAVYAF
ncbi:MipA/OmpV family protein [Undibacterium sp. Ren11W]|uniref:MipA/OmpV family protein n=1 Tax=Undibacterium sp. Ren11W TaxID=3413045 RepID=UPI003BEF5E0D